MATTGGLTEAVSVGISAPLPRLDQVGLSSSAVISSEWRQHKEIAKTYGLAGADSVGISVPLPPLATSSIALIIFPNQLEIPNHVVEAVENPVMVPDHVEGEVVHVPIAIKRTLMWRSWAPPLGNRSAV